MRFHQTLGWFMKKLNENDTAFIKMEHPEWHVYTCCSSIGACITLSVLYVASLYIWNSPHDRDHPTTIKKRFIGVLIMAFVSPIVLMLFLSEDSLKKASLLQQMGLRLPGIVQASIVPLLLTVVLFMGSMGMNSYSGLWKLYAEPMYWKSGFQDLIWIRNHIVAPLSEEWTFRSCMMPLLLQCVNPLLAIIICPLLFGIAHFHHIIERLRSGMDLKMTLIVSCFQFAYTTLFGAYSAFLFVRTGHFIAPLLAHIFCNHMGFPNLNEICQYKPKEQIIIYCLFIAGLIFWCLLLIPLTSPWIYENDIYWTGLSQSDL